MKITAITKGIPKEASFDTAVSYLANAGVLVLSMGAVHTGLKLMKMENNALANAGVGVAALIGAALVPNPWIQVALIAASAFCLTKAAVLATKTVIAPGAAGLGGVTGFIAGLVPEAVKSHINDFLPNFGEVGDYDNTNGYGSTNLDEPVNGSEELMQGMEGTEEAASLLGNAGMLI